MRSAIDIKRALDLVERISAIGYCANVLPQEYEYVDEETQEIIEDHIMDSEERVSHIYRFPVIASHLNLECGR